MQIVSLLIVCRLSRPRGTEPPTTPGLKEGLWTMLYSSLSLGTLSRGTGDIHGNTSRMEFSARDMIKNSKISKARRYDNLARLQLHVLCAMITATQHTLLLLLFSSMIPFEKHLNNHCNNTTYKSQDSRAHSTCTMMNE